MKVLIVDVTRCNGCYNCQIACKDEHVGNDWSPIAKPQPDTGQFWLALREIVRGRGPRTRVEYQPVMCQHCAEAPCRAVCPIEGAIYERSDGAVVIDAERCTGCEGCITACPYGVIYYQRDLQLAQKCTLCAHLLDKGWSEPRCVDACPTDALVFGEECDLQDLIIRSEALHPEYGTNPRVHYIGLSKLLVSGAIYDSRHDEVIKDAHIVLQSLVDSTEVYEGTSNSFGEFFIRNVNSDIYRLTISAAGYCPKVFDAFEVDKDVDLYDIAMSPE